MSQFGREHKAFKLLGVNIHPVTKAELLGYIVDSCIDGKKRILSSLNAHAMNFTQQYPWFMNFVNEADLVYCDGISVMWAMKVFKKKIPERLTHMDWMYDLFDLCEKHQLSLYLLGAKPSVSEKAQKKLSISYPGIPNIDAHHGYFDKEYNSKDNLELIEKINIAKPNIMFVCYGMPLQEKWIQENMSRIDANVIIPGGGTIDFISGELLRVNNFFLKNNVEWLGRLIQEPRRLWKRYIIGNTQFVIRVIWKRLSLMISRNRSDS